ETLKLAVTVLASAVHTAGQSRAAPPFSLPEALRRANSALPGIDQRPLSDLPSNQKCVPDRCATRQSPWARARSAGHAQNTFLRLPCHVSPTPPVPIKPSPAPDPPAARPAPAAPVSEPSPGHPPKAFVPRSAAGFHCAAVPYAAIPALPRPNTESARHAS